MARLVAEMLHALGVLTALPSALHSALHTALHNSALHPELRCFTPWWCPRRGLTLILTHTHTHTHTLAVTLTLTYS